MHGKRVVGRVAGSLVGAGLLLAAASSSAPVPCSGSEVRAAEPAPARPQPPADAVVFGGHAYKIVPKRVAWHAAKKQCEDLGGHLCCIETAEEQKFVARLCAGKYYFLGATDEKAEGKWSWINGSPFKYTAWYEDQPNNYGEEEHWLATYDDGLWVDVAKEGEEFWMPIGFLCEWDAVPEKK